jgi:hypothetical protein
VNVIGVGFPWTPAASGWRRSFIGRIWRRPLFLERGFTRRVDRERARHRDFVPPVEHDGIYRRQIEELPRVIGRAAMDEICDRADTHQRHRSLPTMGAQIQNRIRAPTSRSLGRRR